jgi:hypothetical protein
MDEAGPAVAFGDVLHLGELPRPHRRRADVAGLAGLHHVVQGFHGLVDRGVRVEAVDLVEVDVVGAKTAQRGVDLLHDGFAGEPGSARSVVHSEEHLGRQDDVVASGVLANRPADDLFRGSVAVDVGGVPEGDAEVDGLPEDRLSGLVVEGPLVEASRGVAETHAAEHDAADL